MRDDLFILFIIILVVFSVLLSGHAMAEDIAITHAETPTDFTNNNLTGFHDEKRKIYFADKICLDYHPQNPTLIPMMISVCEIPA
ncbi:MAG: hypothetical protein K0U45_02775 [Alphaproteobacteria bacterium]|nr:hypothetical protein [Alphaproteobacteria bacterium]